MPRGPRQRSKTGIYHVMLRGVNKQDIVFDDQDRKRFIRKLEEAKGEHNFSLYAYCLMTNHVHLLIHEMQEPLERTIRRIAVSHAGYINWKYERVGHLFQDRYRSENIETERRLLACVRYIHNNPVKAGITTDPEKYLWSSYKSFLQLGDLSGLITTGPVLSLFSGNEKTALAEFIQFSRHDNTDDKFLDVEEKKSREERSESLTQVIAHVLKKHNMKMEGLQGANINLRSRIIREIRQNTDASVQELARQLKVSIYMIYRA